MEVVINGAPYAPPVQQLSNIGIAITTHNRQVLLDKALEHQLKHLPTGALVVVIDDGSSKPVTVPAGVRLIRCDMSRGIVASKNASLEALIDASSGMMTHGLLLVVGNRITSALNKGKRSFLSHQPGYKNVSYLLINMGYTM